MRKENRQVGAKDGTTTAYTGAADITFADDGSNIDALSPGDKLTENGSTTRTD